MWLIEHWGASPVALAAGALGALLYEKGRKRLSYPPRPGQAWLFRCGLAVAVLTVTSPLGYWSGLDASSRATEDVLLAYLAAPLVVLGAPWLALAEGVKGGGASWFENLLARSRATKVWSVASSPICALALFSAVFLVWWVPAVVGACARSSMLHGVELASSFLAAMPLWGQVVGSHPFSPRLDLASRTWVILAWLAVPFVVGVAMVFSNAAWYPAYRQVRGAYLSGVADQSIAGGVIWVFPSISLSVVLFWVLVTWLNRDSDDDWQLARLIEDTRSRMMGAGE